MTYKIVDRLGQEIVPGVKLAWVSSSWGTPILKIGYVQEIEIHSSCLVIKANIQTSSGKKYLAKLSEYVHYSPGEREVKVDRAEIVH